jgi:hypothetical protein
MRGQPCRHRKCHYPSVCVYQLIGGRGRWGREVTVTVWQWSLFPLCGITVQKYGTKYREDLSYTSIRFSVHCTEEIPRFGSCYDGNFSCCQLDNPLLLVMLQKERGRVHLFHEIIHLLILCFKKFSFFLKLTSNQEFFNFLLIKYFAEYYYKDIVYNICLSWRNLENYALQSLH